MRSAARLGEPPGATLRNRLRLVAAAAGGLAMLMPLKASPPVRQASAVSGARIERIEIQGFRHFTSEEITAALGLRVGDAVSQGILEGAAERLSQTGGFRDVNFEYSQHANSWLVKFVVIEAPLFLPCTFDNFLWFADSELIAAAHARMPLFNGWLPEGSGAMQGQLIAALGEYLEVHHIAGPVSITPIFPGLGAKAVGYSIRINDVPMPVLRVVVTGGPLDPAALGEAEHGLIGHDYSRHFATRVAETALTEAYQDEGYLRAKFSEPMPAFQDPAGKDASQGIILRYQATSGPRYSWAGVSWTGNHAVAAEELTKLLLVLPGEPARRNRTLAGWDAVREAFGHRGYIAATLDPEPHYDDQASSVRFTVQIAEGQQYRMGELRVDDPSEGAAKQLAAAWPIARGQIYDVSAEKEFRRTGAPRALVRVGVTRKSFGVERDVHQDTATVNVLVRTSQ